MSDAPPERYAVEMSRPFGNKNKKTREREREIALAKERQEALLKAEAMSEVDAAIARAAAQGRKLMKDLGMDFTMKFAGLAAYFQPFPEWKVLTDQKGAVQYDKRGKAILINVNPNYDEHKFEKYAKLAMDGARDFAVYESPKFAAVLMEQNFVTEITIVGGLPDERDGGLIDGANGTTIEITAAEYRDLGQSGAGGAGASGGAKAGASGATNAPPGAGPDISGTGQA